MLKTKQNFNKLVKNVVVIKAGKNVILVLRTNFYLFSTYFILFHFL